MHGRGRSPESMDDLFFGVHDEMLYARKSEPIAGIIILLLLLFVHLKSCFGSYNLFRGSQNITVEIHVKIHDGFR